MFFGTPCIISILFFVYFCLDFDVLGDKTILPSLKSRKAPSTPSKRRGQQGGQVFTTFWEDEMHFFFNDGSPFQKNWRVPWWPLVFIIGTSFHIPKMSWTCRTHEKLGSKSEYFYSLFFQHRILDLF